MVVASLICAYRYFFSLVDPSDNLREILQNVAKLQGVSNMRKLGHLNNFTKVRIFIIVKAFMVCLFFIFLHHAKSIDSVGK